MQIHFSKKILYLLHKVNIIQIRKIIHFYYGYKNDIIELKTKGVGPLNYKIEISDSQSEDIIIYAKEKTPVLEKIEELKVFVPVAVRGAHTARAAVIAQDKGQAPVRKNRPLVNAHFFSFAISYDSFAR